MGRRATDPIRVGAHVTVYPPHPSRAGKQARMHRIVGTRPDGTRRQVWRTDRNQALRAAADLDRQLTAHPAGPVTIRRTTGAPAAGRPTRTVADLADHWLDPTTHLEPWSVSHQAGCESIVRTWIRPRLGDVALEDVTDTMLRQFLNDIRARQPKSVRRIGVALSSMFRLGLEAGWLATNPMAPVRYGHRQRRQGVAEVFVPLDRRPPTEAVLELAEAMDRLWPDERPGDMVLLAAFTGVRKGELFALTDQDVELLDGGGRLDVVRQVQQATHDRHMHLPKYRKIRETFVPDFVADRLAERLTWRLPRVPTVGCTLSSCVDMVPTGGRLLFPTEQSRSWWPRNNFDQRRFRPACRDAEWPRDVDGRWLWSWHDLRHHFCTWALAPTRAGGRGLEVADVSYFAGHSTPEYTMRAYVSPRAGAVSRALRQAYTHHVTHGPKQ